MPPVCFPPGVQVLKGIPFDENTFGVINHLLADGHCTEGRLELETDQTRLTCLIYRSSPFLAGLLERDVYSWVPLREFPLRAMELKGATCRLIRTDEIQVLLSAVHFRNRPTTLASTRLLEPTHLLDVLAEEGQDAALALERAGSRTMLFLQKGVPMRLYFGDPAQDPGEGDIRERFLVFAFAPAAEQAKVEVFERLNILPDPDAGTQLSKLVEASKPPPPVNIQVRMGEKELFQRPFMPPSMTIGRDPTCELRLDNLSVSRKHSRLSWNLGQFLIEDLHSANGISLNGQQIDKSVLAARDRIGVGTFELEIQETGEDGTLDGTIMLQDLSDAPGYLVGEKLSLPIGNEITLGRSPEVDVPVPGWRVKPVHTRIRHEGHGMYSLVCFGKAKVHVNGKKVYSSSIRFGDKIVIGRSSFWLVSKA